MKAVTRHFHSAYFHCCHSTRRVIIALYLLDSRVARLLPIRLSLSTMARRVTRSQTKTSPSPVKLEELPPRPRYADLAVQRQRAQTLPTRRRQQHNGERARNTYSHNAFQQALDEADVMDLTDEVEDEDEEDDEDDEDEDQYEQVDGNETFDDNEEAGEEQLQPTRRRPSPTRQRPRTKSNQTAASASQSLFGQLLPFVWNLLKYSILASLIVMLAAPLLLKAIQPSLGSTTATPTYSHSVLSKLRTALASVTGLFDQPPSSTTIARSVHANLSTIVDHLSAAHPAYAASLRQTIEPSLDDHFDLSSQHSSRPLVLFIAYPPTMPVSALQSFVFDLSSQLYPPAVPSYLLDLTDMARQQHFNGPHLDSLLDRHFAAHNDGLVLLPSLLTLHHCRSVGETLQHWLDDDRAPAKRAVFVLAATMDLTRVKKMDDGDKLGASRERQMLYERLRLAMHEKGDGKREDELVDAILSRVVRNVVVLK